MEFLHNVYVIIGLSSLAVILLGLSVYKFRKIRLMVYGLVVYAERKLKTEAGEKKKEFVVEEIEKLIPVYLKWLVSEKDINRWIDEAIEELKDYLDDGKLNDSIINKLSKANQELNRSGFFTSEV